MKELKLARVVLATKKNLILLIKTMKNNKMRKTMKTEEKNNRSFISESYKELLKKTKNYKIIRLKCYFIILNLVISTMAFSLLVAGQNEETIIPPSNSFTPTSTTSGVDPQTTTTDITPTEGQTEITVTGGGGGNSVGTDGSTVGVIPPPILPPISPGGEGGNGGGGILDGLANINFQSMIMKASIGAGIFGTIGALAGGDKGALWGSLAGAIGGVVAGLTEESLGPLGSTLLGLGVATAIFIFTYKKASEEITEFYCLPWQAPIGGQDCELCNKFEECSEYSCKSLGQACAIINQGTTEQKCIWQNPHDVNSPLIEFKEVSKNHSFKPDPSIRPPSRGVVIKPTAQDCIRAFFPLEFKFITNEPAQCKIDYNLTNTFEEMAFFVNGDNLFKYNHTEKLSLPGPDALNAANPELKNDGNYRLLIRCQDANGNFNQDAYFTSFCVEKGPDTTPPVIVNVNIPSRSPIQFNQSNFNLEVYVNEPSECKWSREDRSYDNMEVSMVCDTNVWQMNNQNVYVCRATLTGIQDRKENKYYFRCKDKPSAPEGDRNVNSQSYLYTIFGTQPLNILEVGPNETIKGATDVMPVFLKIKTDNGYQNGEALCYYYNDRNNNLPAKEEDYVLFHETKSNEHTQRQDLVQGDYIYFFKCVDLGGNAAYASTGFRVDTDRLAPKVIRVYRETELKIITDEKAECSYSNKDCNFEIESGLEMSSFDNYIHTTPWVLNKNHYVRCKDKYDNQPFPNTCSIIVRPSQTTEKESKFLEFGY